MTRKKAKKQPTSPLPQTTIEQTVQTPGQAAGPSAIEKGISGATGVGTLIDLYKKFFP